MINISHGQFSSPLTAEKVIAGVLLANCMTIDTCIYKSCFGNDKRTQTLILNNVTGSGFYKTLRML